MYRNIKIIKTVHRYLNTPINFSGATRGRHNKIDICDITIYLGSLTVIEMLRTKMLGGCHVFYFYFYFYFALR